jgi:ATP-binding cassette subfamily B protein
VADSTPAAGRPPARPAGPKLTTLLAPYRRFVAGIVCLTIAANGLNLLVPKLIARAIDGFAATRVVPPSLVAEFVAVAAAIFVFTYLQNIVQTFGAERVARDLRARLVAKIAVQNLAFVQQITTAKLLTNLTSDVDAVKLFISQAVGSLISSVFLIVGASALLLSIDWKLGLAVMAVLPVIGVTFKIVMGRVGVLFRQAQGVIDWLNKVINESILGAALIRLLDSQREEREKFLKANTEARTISLKILRLFAALIPIIMFCTNVATLLILVLGGRFVIGGAMSLGDFTAFNSYLSILIFPVILIGFMTSIITQATASYGRISAVLAAPPPAARGTRDAAIAGDITVSHVTVRSGDRDTLKDVSLSVKAGTRTAVIGPTAAGKSQFIYVLGGLLDPASGTVAYDGYPLADYDKASMHRQVAVVFQDATLFNLSLRENIGFSRTATDADLARAIATAELADFVATLPQGLDTIVAERGSSLSGGQKQRIMLARALALNPRVLLLDDFTARVDIRTEQRILQNVRTNYPGITLVSVTQKIAPVEDYDQIVLLMEGEVLAIGTHPQLLNTCAEYAQIYESQRSTSHYEPVQA